MIKRFNCCFNYYYFVTVDDIVEKNDEKPSTDDLRERLPTDITICTKAGRIKIYRRNFIIAELGSFDVNEMMC